MFEFLKVALLIAGVLHLAPLCAGLTVPRVLRWGSDLGKLDALTRKLIWVHGVFIAITVLAFGLITVTARESMLQGTPLAIGTAAFIGLFWFLLKVSTVIYLLIWFRGTFPRYRYDQLMNIGWKVAIPIGMAAVLVNAVLGMI